jgi:hypothetical protein
MLFFVFGGFMRFLCAMFSILLLAESSFAATWSQDQRALTKMSKVGCGALNILFTSTISGVTHQLNIRTSGYIMQRAEGGEFKQFHSPLTRGQVEALLHQAQMPAEEIQLLMNYLNGLSSEYVARLSVEIIKPSATEPYVARMSVVSHDAGQGGLLIPEERVASAFRVTCIR